MTRHQRLALTIIAAAVLLDVVLGVTYSAVTPHLPVWHGIYVALANAATLGGDVAPENTAGYVINAVECLTVVPLFAGALSLFTSGLTAGHVEASEERVKAHVEARLRKHLGKDAAG